MYNCEKCGKYFIYCYLLKKHQNRKTPCDTIENITDNYNENISNKEKEIKLKIEESVDNLICSFCNKIQTNKSNTIKHIKNFCKESRYIYNLIDNMKNEKEKLIYKTKIKTHEEEIKIRDEEIKALKNELNNKNNNNITINNINNNTQNNLVMINPFGKEDLSHLTLQDYKKYLNGFFPGLVEYIEKVHFDENAPQNHNICISNLKSKYITIHNGTKWVTHMRDDVINRFINRKHNQLIDKREELEDLKKIDKKIIDNFDEFCETLKNNDAQKSIKNDVITMLYDNKDKIKIRKKENKNEIEIEIKNEIKPKKKIKSK